MNAEHPKLEFLRGPDLSAAVDVERRQRERSPVNMTGRLAYGGITPGLVGCDILDLSETGVRIETYTALRDIPEILSIEFSSIYCRVRRRWANDKQIGLEFVYD